MKQLKITLKIISAVILGNLLGASLSIATQIPQSELPETTIAENQEFQKTLRPVDPAIFIPGNLQPTNDEKIVAQKFLDHSVNSYLSSPAMRKSSLYRSARQLEDTLKTDVMIPSSSFKHIFTFQYMAFQKLASVKYRGLLDAQLSYKLGTPAYDLEMNRRFFKKTQFVYERKKTDEEDIMNQISLRWDW